MDVTSLIFVALAVAWAVYLVPKALQATDEGSVTHSVERFSSALRVLRGHEDAAVAPAAPVARPSARQIKARREAARRAAQRRRRVLGTILLINVVVGLTAGFGVIAWVWQAAPVALLVAWLVACRLMVRSEQAARAQAPTAPVRIRMPRRPADSPVTASPADQELADAPEQIEIERNEQGFDEVAPEADTSTIPAVTEGLWEPVPITLPTYVSAPAATRRTVRTIDLSAPGVTTSGRTEEDAAIAREADEAERQAKLASIARRIRKSS